MIRYEYDYIEPWHIYSLKESTMKWRKVDDKAELHFEVYDFAPSDLKLFQDGFETVIKKDVKAAGCTQLVAIATTTGRNMRTLAHFWQTMGFTFFCGVMEV